MVPRNLWLRDILEGVGAVLTTDDRVFFDDLQNREKDSKSQSYVQVMLPILRDTGPQKSTKIKSPRPILLRWLSNQDAWMEQWPIIEPKLSILKEISWTAAKDWAHRQNRPQVNVTHTSHIFVIPYRLGCYHLLQDLCAVSDQMKKMESTQPGLPLLLHSSLLLHFCFRYWW